MGPKRLHGPHQSAQKSTSTMSLPLMVSSKLLALMSTVAMLAPRSGTAADLLRRLAQPDLRSDYSLLSATQGGSLDRHDPPHGDGDLDRLPPLQPVLQVLDRRLDAGLAGVRQVQRRHHQLGVLPGAHREVVPLALVLHPGQPGRRQRLVEAG